MILMTLYCAPVKNLPKILYFGGSDSATLGNFKTRPIIRVKTPIKMPPSFFIKNTVDNNINIAFD